MRIEFLMEVLKSRRDFYEKMKGSTNIDFLKYVDLKNEPLVHYFNDRSITFNEICREYDYLIELFGKFESDDNNEW